MACIPSPAQARALLEKYNKEEFHLLHGRTVSAIMGWYARQYDPGREDFWRVVGMLHDIDFEQYPHEHCVKGAELLRGEGVDESVVHACMSHGWGMTKTTEKPECFMEQVLFAVDELSGLIWAAALVRPSKSVADMEVKSIKKKFKDKAFAAGCSRETIRQGAEMMGWTLDELMEKTLAAMKNAEGELARATTN